jgi:hypothetical protein
MEEWRLAIEVHPTMSGKSSEVSTRSPKSGGLAQPTTPYKSIVTAG